MSIAILLRHLSFNNFANHRISHPQWLTRNAVRCFSHNNADASGFPVRYISKRRQYVDNKQSPSSATDISLQQGIPSTSDSTVFPRKSFQGLRVDSTEEKMLKSEGPILNHWDGNEKDLTDEEHLKVHKQVFPRKSFQGLLVENTEGKMLKSKGPILNHWDGHEKDLTDEKHIKVHKQVFPRKSFQGLRVENTEGKMLKSKGPILNHWDGHEKYLANEEHVKVHKQVVDSTVFPRKSFQGLRVENTEGKMLKSKGPILNHWDGHEKDLTDEEHIKVHKHVVDSTSTVFPCKSFQDLRVDSTEGKMLKSEGPILNHRHGHEKDLTDEEPIKVHEQVVDCMKTGEVVAHNSLTYKSGGRREGIILNEELGSDGLVDEECMEGLEEVCEDVESNNTYFKAPDDKTRKGAEKLAVQLLARRAFTVVELRKKLGAKLFPLNIVEAVVRDFQNRGLINDSLYAETFSHSRWKSSSWGPRRIKQALSTKGVNKHDVEKAVKLVFEDPEEGEQNSSVRLSSCSLHQLYIQASKQWQRSRDVAHEKRKARVIRWLEYRGFDWGVIGSIIKKLESENPRGILP